MRRTRENVVVDVNSLNIYKILRLLIFKGPHNKYQAQKELKLKHATLSDSFERLIKIGYLEVSSIENSPIGRKAIYYRVSPAGFWELLAWKTNIQKEIWGNVEEIIEKQQYLWFPEEISICKKIHAPELLRYLIKIYDNQYLSERVTVATSAGEPLPQKLESKPMLVTEYRAAIARFLLKFLHPDIDVDLLSSFLETDSPFSYDDESLQPDAINSLRQQIKRYLAVRKDLADYIRKCIFDGKDRLEEFGKDLDKIQSDLLNLNSLG